MEWFIVNLFVFFVSVGKGTHGMTFSVQLSPALSQRHNGQLLAYFTFTSGASNSLSFKVLQGHSDPSARLYLFAVGTQHMLRSDTDAGCANFYQMSIFNVSLAQGQGQFTVGSFSGHFPTFLVYADSCTCESVSCSLSRGNLNAIITILNPNQEPLSGSLVGLRIHLFGLLVFYALAVACAFYFVRLAMCCTASCEALMESGQRLVNHDRTVSVTAGCELKNIGRTGQICCAPCCGGVLDNAGAITSSGARSSISRADGAERRLYLLTTLLCIQFASVLFCWMELSRLAQSGSHSLKSLHPVSGADGLYSQIAELLALLNQFAMLRLLIIHASELTGSSVRGHRPHQELRQPCCPTTPSNSPPTNRRLALSLSIFRFGRLLSWNRLINSILVIQVFWYILKEVAYQDPMYTGPSQWPMEEHQGFWAGLGVPVPRYLPQLSSGIDVTGSNQQHSTVRTYMGTITLDSSFAPLLTIIRTAIGLTLSMRLLRLSGHQRSEQTRKVNSNCGWLGCAWFLTHPTLLLLGTLFADHVRYKFTIVGITLSQAAIFATLLFLMTRQTFLWDISSLSASLPILKRTTGFPIAKR
ncbi:hypothetical protein CSKR_107854 [Clonorchis sinensis]|uniref:Intimal thickness related receptor IRP domain-containing protein n=1 Tax=Clonorchis sinensis TaxID=79923 RepID=A0A8T1MEM7_CLOSI|nr:hypothetical protein CSKR_107854 [Clonorchis sinensis]